MKRLSFIIFALSFSAALFAKDIKTVVLKTQPEMHCENCEKKIKDNIRFEKGIKDIKTNLVDKTVTIEYDADKTNVENIIAGFKKIKYEVSEATAASAGKKDCCEGEKKHEGCGDGKKADCCGKEKKDDNCKGCAKEDKK